MKVSTLSIVVGTAACDAGCPFCVSKMTPANGVLSKAQPIEWARLFKTLLFAERMGVTTVILTGKGEPTLFPDQITAYLKAGVGLRFPFVELQTNGLTLSFGKLLDWQALGLTTVALSVVHYLPAINQRIYYAHRPQMEYPPLENTISMIHNAGLSVRLSVVMVKGGIENSAELDAMIHFCRENKVEQLSIRPVTPAVNSLDPGVTEWIKHKPARRASSLDAALG
jgi:molybdenum cofactor biosynthesis enzyme MoaA